MCRFFSNIVSSPFRKCDAGGIEESEEERIKRMVVKLLAIAMWSRNVSHQEYLPF